MSAEKQFYSAHYLVKTSSENTTLEQSEQKLKEYGQRYFCVFDVLKQNAARLNAIEWGFGSVAMSTTLNRFFGSYEAVDLVASELLQNNTVDFRYSEHNLNHSLPYQNETYDAVIAMMVIEHLFDPFHSFKEVARLLKPGGHAFINLPLVVNLKNRLRFMLGRLPITSSPYSIWWKNEEWDGGHLHYFNIPFIKQLAQRYGLNFVKLYPVGNLPHLKKLCPSLLCGEGSFVFVKNG